MQALEHIHEVGADLPEECIMALNDEIPVGLAMLYSGYMQIEKYLSGAFTHSLVILHSLHGFLSQENRFALI